MASYWRLHYHLVWATYQREPWLTESIEQQIYGTILNKSKDLNCIVHTIGGTEDHVHIVVSIPPKLSVAETVRQFKGASAYYINHLPQATETFRWQGGYGALTFGERSMNTIINYVRQQREHHRQQTTIDLYERLEANH